MSKKSIEKEHRHRAPEIVLGQTPSFASDMCSLGVDMADASSKTKSIWKAILRKDKESAYNGIQNLVVVLISYLLSQLKANV